MKLSVVAVLLAAGCGTSIQSTTINASPRPLAPRPVETVQVFTSGGPDRPYVDVALLEAEQSSTYSSDDTPQMLSELRKRGAAMGCDGLVFNGLSARRDRFGVENLLGDTNPGDRKGVYATCIVYTSPDDLAAAGTYKAKHDHDKCLARQREVNELAYKVSDPRARKGILGTMPNCDEQAAEPPKPAVVAEPEAPAAM